MAVDATALASEFSVTLQARVLLTIVTVPVAYGVAQLVTVLVSLFRLAFRLKIGRFWWEDAWAAVAMVSTLAYATIDLISVQASQSRRV